MSDKQGLVPIVTQEVASAIKAEMLQSNSNDYIIEILERLGDGDNPSIANYLGQLANQSRTPFEKQLIVYAGLGVYRLIESQIEANKMKKELD